MIKLSKEAQFQLNPTGQCYIDISNIIEAWELTLEDLEASLNTEDGVYHNKASLEKATPKVHEQIQQVQDIIAKLEDIHSGNICAIIQDYLQQVWSHYETPLPLHHRLEVIEDHKITAAMDYMQSVGFIDISQF